MHSYWTDFPPLFLAYIVKNKTSGAIMKCYDMDFFSSEENAYNNAQE